MATSNTPAKSSGAQAARREAVLQRFSELVLQVPEAEDDDGTGILERILDAQGMDDLGEQGSLPSSQSMVGKPIVVTDIRRRPSDKGSSTGWYLICEGYEPKGRKPVRFSAGGDTAVAVLSRAYVLGIMPCRVSFTETETRSGNTVIECALTVADRDTRVIDG